MVQPFSRELLQPLSRSFLQNEADKKNLTECEADAFLASLSCEDGQKQLPNEIQVAEAILYISESALRTRFTNIYRKFGILGRGPGRFLELYHSLKRKYDQRKDSETPKIPRQLKSAPNNRPHRGSLNFVGREDDLKNLHQQLQTSSKVAITAVVGMGGIGKTELALQYIIHYGEKNYLGGICWLNGRDQDIGTQIVEFARTQVEISPPDTFSLQDQVAYCWRNWPLFSEDGKYPEAVLVVVDDVTGYQKIESYLPIQKRFTLLMTTRIHLGASVQSFEIDVLHEIAALQLLRKLAGAERIDSDLDRAKSICHWLGYLPLALELVGRYLGRKPDCSLLNLQERLNTQTLKAHALQKIEEGMTASLSVASAFELSWNELSKVAQNLAMSLSLFAPTPIPWELLEECWSNYDPNNLESFKVTLPSFRELVETGGEYFTSDNSEYLQEILEDVRDEELQKLSLIQRVGFGTYQLHSLIHQFIRTKLNKSDQKSILITSLCCTMVLVAKQRPQFLASPTMATWQTIMPHLSETIDCWIKEVSDKDLLPLFQSLAKSYELQGAYPLSESWRNRSVTVLKERLGYEHVDVATSLFWLAKLCDRQSHFSKAASIHQEALEIRRRLLGEVHKDIAASLNNLASVYNSMGNYSEVESLAQQALEMQRQLLGNEHNDVASSIAHLGHLCNNNGKYVEAKKLFQEAFAIWKRLGDFKDMAKCLGCLGAICYHQSLYQDAEKYTHQSLYIKRKLWTNMHPEVARGLIQLSTIYLTKGQYGKAESLCSEALEVQKKFLDSDHIDIAYSLHKLASIYQSQGRYNESESLCSKSLEMMKQLLGNEHPSVAISLNKLANIYQDQGRYNDAKSLCNQALEMRRQLLGSDHPSVANSLQILASIYRNQGRYNESESLYSEALEIGRRLLGSNHLSVANSLQGLASVYRNQGRYNEAEALYDEALAMKKRLLGHDHLSVANSLHDLASVYRNQGQYNKAEPLYNEALEIRKQFLGHEHPSIAISFQGLGQLYEAQNFHSTAEEMFQKALDLRKQLLGEEHPITATSLNDLARILTRQSCYQRAEILFKEALTLKQKLLNEEHPNIATTLNDLALLYVVQERYIESDSLFQKALILREKKLGFDHPLTCKTRENIQKFQN